MAAHPAERRLEALARRVPVAHVVADVGCDHGRLGELLLRTRPELRLIASDVSAASLMKARRRLGGQFAPARFEARLGDGLEVLRPGEADVIVIAGIGGRTIADILSRCPAPARAARLLLAPHSHVGAVRRVLGELDFAIENEWVAEERGHFYPILLAAPGGGRIEQDAFWYDVGRVLPTRADEASRRYGRHLRRNAERALWSVGETDPARADELRRIIGRLGKTFPAETDGRA